MASRWRRLTTIPASAPTRTRLSSTRHRGSRSPTMCLNTRRVSPARTLLTIPDKPIARDSGSRRHAGVCWSFGEGTFAGKHGNGRDAPIPDLPALALEWGGSTQSRRSILVTRTAVPAPFRTFEAAQSDDCLGWTSAGPLFGRTTRSEHISDGNVWPNRNSRLECPRAANRPSLLEFVNSR